RTTTAPRARPSCCGCESTAGWSGRSSRPRSRSSSSSRAAAIPCRPPSPREPSRCPSSKADPRSRRSMSHLEIRNLHVRAGDKEILKGLDLSVQQGQVHALMGPNGSGKSTLANAIMGHPGLEVTDGQILFKGEDITEAEP